MMLDRVVALVRNQGATAKADIAKALGVDPGDSSFKRALSDGLKSSDDQPSRLVQPAGRRGHYGTAEVEL